MSDSEARVTSIKQPRAAVEVTRFPTENGWTMVEAETGKVTVYGFQIFSLKHIEAFAAALQEAAKIAGLQ